VSHRFGFAGTSDYAADCLRRLVVEGIEPAFVLTQPDRPAGRNRRLTAPPAALAARELGLTVIAPEHAIDALPTIAAAGVAAVAICAYGQILPAALLAAVPWLNVHPSLLPRWRGAAPIERAILAGDTETAVAVIETTLALDAGPVVSVDRFPLEGLDAGAAMNRSLELGVPRLAAALRACAAGTLVSTPQREEGITYAHKLGAVDRPLDPAVGVRDALLRVRALAPHIGATIVLGGERLVVWRAERADVALEPGAVRADHGAIAVGFGDGALSLLELQAPGKRSLSAAALLRGWRKPLGPATGAG
jgi:methionyl-tRNA formyltransferase